MEIEKGNLVNRYEKYYICANGDILGLTPPSCSMCAIMHAILSSLHKKKISSQAEENYHFARKIKNETNFSVSPPKIAAKNKSSCFSANLLCHTYRASSQLSVH